MKAYGLPFRIRAIAFDIDRTLYDNDAYADDQIDSQYRRAAVHWGVSEEEARQKVRSWRDEYGRRNDGATTSLGNSLAGLGIPIETSVVWRNETIVPADYLSQDENLVRAVSSLARRVPLVAVTNNPVQVGNETLTVLGVRSFFGAVVGLDTTWRSKPDPESFREALRQLGVPADETVSVGDRYDVDIEPALSLGMGGILVEGVREVYDLPVFLSDRLPGAATTGGPAS